MEPNEEDVISQLLAFKEEVKQKKIYLKFPEKTGIASIDEKNYEEYLYTLEAIRPDLFIYEEDNYVEPSANKCVSTCGSDGRCSV